MNDTTLDLAASAVLDRAANLITSEGHLKEDYHDDNGACCAAGAIAAASGLHPTDWHDRPQTSDHEQERAASLTALHTLIGHLYPDSRPEEMSRDALIVKIGDWNDADERTADEVIDAMRAAAREATRG